MPASPQEEPTSWACRRVLLRRAGRGVMQQPAAGTRGPAAIFGVADAGLQRGSARDPALVIALPAPRP